MSIALPHTAYVKEDRVTVGSILKLLAYFDMFDHPVSMEEIHSFIPQKVYRNELILTLEKLLFDKLIFCYNGFYSLRNDECLSAKRIKANNLAEPLIGKANDMAKFFFRFPYVRGIGISGSLSKKVAAEDSDIDLFIITRSNRLWIARTLMCLFIKLFYLVKRPYWYCLNYFIDEEALQIKEKNVFTAIETMTLIPVCGNGTMDKFFNANSWITNYYHDYPTVTKNHKTYSNKHWIKTVIEWLLNNRVGGWLDNYFFRLTKKRWNKMEEKGITNEKGQRFGMEADKHYSKPNPVFFQEKLLARYSNRLNELKAKLPEYFN
jgi:hypothetical protein